MSVKKRKQARALQDLVRRIPLTNLLGLYVIYFMATNAAGTFELMMEGTTGWWVGLVIGGLVGIILFGALQKRIQRFENKFKSKLQDMAQKIESSADEEDKSQNKLLDAFEIQYLGGHPGLRVSDKLVFGTLEVREKSLIFKNREARIKIALSRLRRISIEPDRLVRHKKLPNVKIPPMPVFKKRLLKAGYEQLRKLQRYVMLDYQDDLGERHFILFYPMIGHPLFGNPLKAKAIKAAVDEPLGKYNKDNKRGTKSFAKGGKGKSSKGGTAKLSSQAAPREAEASVPQAPPVPQPASPPPVPPNVAAASPHAMPDNGLRYQVSLVGAGSTPGEQQAVAQQISQLFGLPLEKAQAAVQRVPLVVKRNLTEAQADELFQSLSATGAQVSVEVMSPSMGVSPS